MVARINTGKRMIRALNYNEKKVQHKEAECIHAQNFLKESGDLNFYEKLKTFEKYTSLNDLARTNTVHISLNFDPSEKLPNEQLTELAKIYMERIGFKDQPYIVYRHYDAGHPHIHILSTNIKRDGSRISMHNMGRNESEAARKSIEKDFDLVQAESRRQAYAEQLKPVHAQKIIAGKRSTKDAISNVLRTVIPQYKYSSLAELNAILVLYNIRADRCGENSETYKHEGLLFRVLDKDGHPISTPVKASRFWMKPTLKNLKVLFEKNNALKQPHAQRLKSTIDYTFRKTPGIDLKKLEEELKNNGISLVLRKNKDGIIYGMTYVDHKTKTVFNGSDLGKQYSAKGILERCEKRPATETLNQAGEKKKSRQTEMPASDLTGRTPFVPVEPFSTTSDSKLLDALLKPASNGQAVPYDLKITKRKRKKKRFGI